MTILFLTNEERHMLHELHPELEAAWEDYIRDEELSDCFETPEQMEFRMSILRDEENPTVKGLMSIIKEKLDNHEPLESIRFSEFTEEQMQVFYSCMGASGMTAIIDASLEEADTNEDLDGIAAMTHVRHALLKSNAEFFAHA